jgi:glyoxylase-like metal-dependent hydrolase (beta-lactamase superfamily II)/rhodanese-related sulfurtransferase
MEVIQFEDKSLAHYSYAVISNGEMAVIDPARNPQPYYDLAQEYNAKIIAVIETHPHADFVSSHLEIHKTTGAPIYVSKLLSADYEHKTFDDGDVIKIGAISLKALNTPGHSPDSICIVAINEEGKEEAVFTGDTLFIGDCGRPDLRESAGALVASRNELAKKMYHSLRDQLMTLPENVLVYPAHGAGSLCGRGLSEKNSSTIGIEKASNWCLQPFSEEDFVEELLKDQPFIPRYFGYDVELNKKGAANYADAIAQVMISEERPSVLKDYVIIDSRDESDFKKGFIKNSINLMDDFRFETWLGSIVASGERFYLASGSKEQLQSLIGRAAKIGYESQIETAFVLKEVDGETIQSFDAGQFRQFPDSFTILDVRNPSEVKEQVYFPSSINIPLYELRERGDEIPTGKPVVVHCVGGYRSAAAAGILKNVLTDKTQVFDMGEAVKTLSNEKK